MSSHKETHIRFRLTLSLLLSLLPLLLLLTSPQPNQCLKSEDGPAVLRDGCHSPDCSLLACGMESPTEERNTLQAMTIRTTTNNSSHQRIGDGSGATAGGHNERVDHIEQAYTQLVVTSKQPLESTSWRFRYVTESSDKFELILLEQSLDERLANVLDTVMSVGISDVDIHRVDTGDPQMDAQRLASIQGPQVDDSKCQRHLEAMLALIDEWQERLERRRAQPNGGGGGGAEFSLNMTEAHIRLGRVLDSYGRYESGHLAGRMMVAGSYEECVTTSLLLRVADQSQQEEQEELVDSRYCWARWNVKRHLNAGLRARQISVYETVQKTLQTGICLPITCHSASFQKPPIRRLIERLTKDQFKLPKSIYLDETLELEGVDCLVDADSEYGQFPFSGRLLIGVATLWIIATCYATYKQTPSSARNGELGGVNQKGALSEKGAAESVWSCLDLRTSLFEFLEWNEKGVYEPQQRSSPNSFVNLDTLNPIKVLGCVFVVFGHAAALRVAITQNLPRGYRQIEKQSRWQAAVVCTLVVDTFFVITGLLMMYIMMIKANKPKESIKSDDDKDTRQSNDSNNVKSKQDANMAINFFKQWYKFSIVRWTRLVPLFALIFWHKKSIFTYLHPDAPMWDSGLNHNTVIGSCGKDSWLTPFTFLSAYKPIAKQCLGQSWSVSNDLFFSIFMAPILLIATKKLGLAKLLGCVTIAASVKWALTAINAMDGETRAEFEEVHSVALSAIFSTYSSLYTYPHFRLSSVLLGALAGYHLFKYDQKFKQQTKVNSTTESETTTKKQEPSWPHWLAGPATKVALFSIFALVLGFAAMPHVKRYISPYHKIVIAHLMSGGRVIYAACNAIIMLRMVSDWRNSLAMRLAAGSFWRAMVKLNFAILMVHFDYLIYGSSVDPATSLWNPMTIFSLFSSTYLSSLVTAMLLYVMFENPVHKLVKGYLLPRIVPS